MSTLKNKEPINFNKLGKVLFLNFSLLALMILSLKLPIISISLLFIMPIYCKLYLKEDLFIHFIPVDLFTTVLFEISLIPGGLMLILLDVFGPFRKTVTN